MGKSFVTAIKNEIKRNKIRRNDIINIITITTVIIIGGQKAEEELKSTL